VCTCSESYYTIDDFSYNSTVSGERELVFYNSTGGLCDVNQTQWAKLFNNSDVVAEEVEEEEEAGEEDSDSDGGSAVPAPAPAPAPAAAAGFAELVNVGAMLSSSASSGSLDVGYEVLSLTLVLPDDVCGVPGGNGTTCDDVCGVPRGNNATCSDVCGVPFGDGSSCLVEETTFFECNGLERHSVLIESSAHNYLSGVFSLMFNGAETGELSIFATASDVRNALQSLSSLGTVEVTPLHGDNRTEYSTFNRTSDGFSGSYLFHFGVEFQASVDGDVRNLGEMPLMIVNSSKLSGFDSFTVERTCAGALPADGGYTLEEQLVTVTADEGNLLSDVSGAFRLVVDTENDKPWRNESYWKGRAETFDLSMDVSMSGLEMSQAIVGFASGISDVNLVSNGVEVFIDSERQTAVSRVLRVRFYNVEGSGWLRVGDRSGDLPLLKVNVNSLAGGSVVVTELIKGAVPESAIPVNEIAAANAAAAVAAALAAEAAALAAAAAAENAIEVVAVVYVCGDGNRGTAEACDDGNEVDSDGCSSSCEVEYGYECSSVVGQTSKCFVPINPTFSFEQKNYGPVNEGEEEVVTVYR